MDKRTVILMEIINIIATAVKLLIYITSEYM